MSPSKERAAVIRVSATREGGENKGGRPALVCRKQLTATTVFGKEKKTIFQAVLYLKYRNV